MLFKKNLIESNRKPKKILVDKSKEFYNRSMKWLQDNNKKMYSTHSEGKSVLADKFIRTLKNLIYKYMPSLSKNVYTDNLDCIVNKYNKIYHRKITLNAFDAKSTTSIDFNKENNKKGPKFKFFLI